ncbi:hypothetical protein [Marinilabilia salmonicolor]|uniref:Uncharacterized protein n=1 Tax=Marinilabilia salmonicolor TaxID=989 RepID=A0A368UN84_9BACT|nr:hypothetical protein [Marinilabilia salmonicolor]RCW29645.1 hypothetical protein DFO77_1262 [Marinilabilia salmonicolor]
MADLISSIGTISSVGSIPLAIYFYLKSSEQKVAKVRREIVRTLSYQLKDDKHLVIFEIQAVINSKAREHKIKRGTISSEEVLEDLISETISNPLIDNERKNFFINNFKNLLTKTELYDTIEELSAKEEPVFNEKEIENRLLELVKKQKDYHKTIEKKFKKANDNFSSLFGLIGAIGSVVIGVLTILGDEVIIGRFFDFANDKTELFNFVISGFAALATLLATIGIKKALNRKGK